MTGRRGALLALALVIVGGLLVVLAAGREWGRATLSAATGTPVHVSVTGRQVSGALSPLGVAALALSLAVVAARPLLRRVVAVLIVVVGAAAVAVAVNARGDVGHALARRAFGVQVSAVHVTPSVWSVVAVVGGVVAAAGGIATLLVARRWSGLGTRYEPPGSRRPVDVTATAWDALDRGEDPTALP